MNASSGSGDGGEAAQLSTSTVLSTIPVSFDRAMTLAKEKLGDTPLEKIELKDEHGTLNLTSIPADKAAAGADCALIITDHQVFNYEQMVKDFPLVVDTRNALRRIDSDKIFRL